MQISDQLNIICYKELFTSNSSYLFK